MISFNPPDEIRKRITSQETAVAASGLITHILSERESLITKMITASESVEFHRLQGAIQALGDVALLLGATRPQITSTDNLSRKIAPHHSLY